MNSQAALITERNETVQRILALQGVSFAARMSRKKPQAIEQLRSEIQTLRSRVRALNQQISDAA